MFRFECFLAAMIVNHSSDQSHRCIIISTIVSTPGVNNLTLWTINKSQKDEFIKNLLSKFFVLGCLQKKLKIGKVA